MKKKCNSCHELLPIEHFSSRQAKCKPCCSLYSSTYREKNKEKIKQYSQTDQYKASGKKYRENNKGKIKQNNIKYNSNPDNEEKIKQYRKEYNSKPENQEKQKHNYKNQSQDPEWKKMKSDYNKEWNRNNKEKIKNYNKLWRELNQDYIKEYNSLPETKEKTNKRVNEKYHNDHYYKLVSILRIRFYQVVKNKSNSTLAFLSCSVDELKIYLESLFLPEMTWENHGDIWEIDHILPCASFDFTQDGSLEKCFHYSNHQPLFKTTEIAESFGYTDQIGNRNKGKKLL